MEIIAGLFCTFLFLFLPVFALVAWWGIGHYTESQHLKSLAEREAKVGDFPVTSLKVPVGCQPSQTHPPTIVSGEAVVASDVFKTWVFGWRNIFGGEAKSFSVLFDRARREATLRMIAEAKAGGYNAICNVRFESVDIGGNATNTSKKKGMNMAVCHAYGTAYTRGV